MVDLGHLSTHFDDWKWNLKAHAPEGIWTPTRSTNTWLLLPWVRCVTKSTRSSKPIDHSVPERQTMTKASPFGRLKTNQLPSWWDGALTIFVYYMCNTINRICLRDMRDHKLYCHCSQCPLPAQSVGRITYIVFVQTLNHAQSTEPSHL